MDLVGLTVTKFTTKIKYKFHITNGFEKIHDRFYIYKMTEVYSLLASRYSLQAFPCLGEN